MLTPLPSFLREATLGTLLPLPSLPTYVRTVIYLHNTKVFFRKRPTPCTSIASWADRWLGKCLRQDSSFHLPVQLGTDLQVEHRWHNPEAAPTCISLPPGAIPALGDLWGAVNETKELLHPKKIPVIFYWVVDWRHFFFFHMAKS